MQRMDVPFPDEYRLPRDAIQPPVRVLGPARQSAPLVFASPHSGRDYPPEFIAAARLNPLALRRSEDSFVDELFASAPYHGAPLVIATFPRAFCDANREPWELDPAMFEEDLPGWVNTTSPRVGAGLGTIPRVVASGETIYRGKLRFAEAERRVQRYWQPYHDQLGATIEATKRCFGWCLLVDCHSMPAACGGRARPGRETADVVLGDAHGSSCAPALSRAAEVILMRLGLKVRRNDPYAGGYITRHYGRPREGVHALQIEIARALYMDEARIEPHARFRALHDQISFFIAALMQEAVAALAPR